ncbi:hypothetical protein [Nocardioides dongxiaopingii]|jgi:type IV secretory pathway component VirB8|uniref:hypothetical protein n=1 Tax=Nocardioides TaxID=1839 RepID=UPI001FEB285C|nr:MULTISPECIES: hypothetical protein [Nocardioides]
MTDEKTTTDAPRRESAAPEAGDDTTSTDRGRSLPGMDLAKLRIALARALWAVCVLFALILASAVLMIALEANPANDLVRFVVDRADDVDLGFFDLSNPIKDFDTALAETQDTKTALFNYGIAAIVWLVVGRIVDRLVRP